MKLRTAAVLLFSLSPILLSPLCFAHSEDEPTSSTTIPVSQNQVLKLTDQGIQPAILHMKLEDSIVFLLNDSSDSLATIEIDYNGKFTHCASSNLEVTPNKTVRSKRPFGPHDFASVCFHEKGIYPVKAYGLKKSPQGISGTIEVE